MSYGLVSQGGNMVPLRKIECIADVTDDFGLFTLKQKYINETDDILNVEYIFPIAEGVILSDFSAAINDREFHSELIIKTNKNRRYNTDDTISLVSKYNNFLVKLGDINPGDTVNIEITYIKNLLREHERTRIVIPTVVAPRFIDFGSQIALESILVTTEYEVSLDLTYRNCSITNVVSPSHDIVTSFMNDGVNVHLKNSMYLDRDIIIDVYTLNLDKPKMFYHNNIICCSFTPEIDVYERQSRDYLFMLDISRTINDEKLRQLKNALLICLRSLQKGDKFNIVVFKTQNSSFSDEFLPINDDTLKVASKWIEGLDISGGTEFFRPIIEAYKYAENAVALLFTDGQITGNDDILDYIKNHKGITFYTFGIENAVNEIFLSKLSSVTGGKAQFITKSERIDNAIINAFNIISAPSVTDASISFDETVNEIVPNYINRIHCGEKICIMAKCGNSIPKKLFLRGKLILTETEITVPFNQTIKVGESLLYLFAMQKIDDLLSHLSYDGSVKDENIKSQIADLSFENKIHSIYTSFVVTDSNTYEQQTIEINAPILKPFNWYQSCSKTEHENERFTKTDEHFIELAKKQRANGSFIQNGHRKKENIALHSADILYEFSSQCPNVDMYIWQLRKTAGFLLDFIENSEYGIIPPEIVNALSVWYDVLGGNDEISQKAAALEFLHREK